jgi:Zn-dependent protease with chaperone function
MIAALERLQSQTQTQQAALPAQMATLGISGAKPGASLFASHPSLHDRIEALRAS